MERKLQEYINDHLNEWNKYQKDIWLKLVSLKKVEKENTNLFIKFSEWFGNFFLDEGKYPTLNEVLKQFIGEENEIEESNGGN